MEKKRKRKWATSTKNAQRRNDRNEKESKCLRQEGRLDQNFF